MNSNLQKFEALLIFDLLNTCVFLVIETTKFLMISIQVSCGDL